jgi:hypothetical protein
VTGDMERAKRHHLEKIDRDRYQKLMRERDKKRKYGRKDPKYIPARRDLPTDAVGSNGRMKRRRQRKKETSS